MPLSPNKIPQFVQPLPCLGNIPVVGGAAVELSICEFQQTILPPGTPVVGAVAGVAPATWVWGYQVGATCNPAPAPGGSYLGPVIVAKKGTPTQVTYNCNMLGDSQTTHIAEPTSQSTDQTLLSGPTRWGTTDMRL